MKQMLLLLFASLVGLASAGGQCIANSNNATQLPTYYQTERTLQLDTPHYFKAKLCTGYPVWKEYNALKFTLIIPLNPQCQDINNGCIYLEMFNNTKYEGTPIATNYYKQKYRTAANAEFVISYEGAVKSIVDAGDYVYFRAMGSIAQLTASIRFEPTLASPSLFIYEPGMFPAVPAGQVSQSLAQFTHVKYKMSINAGDRCLIGLNFCVEDYSHAPNVGIGIVGTDELSTFNSYVCYSNYGGGATGCHPDGNSVTCKQEGSCYDESSQAFNNIEVPGEVMSETAPNKKGNLLIGVIGQGGWPDLHNTFDLYAKMTPQPYHADEL